MSKFEVARNIDLEAGQAWYALHVFEGREAAASAALVRDEIRVYMPGLVIETTYRWRQRRLVRLPLFPGYLLVGLDIDALPDMRRWSRQGVQGLLLRVGMPGVPAEIPRDAIATIWKAEIAGLFKRTHQVARRCDVEATNDQMSKRGLKPGDPIEWRSEDALQGVAAELVEAEPDMRVVILLQMFGATRHVPVPLDKIGPA